MSGAGETPRTEGAAPRPPAIGLIAHLRTMDVSEPFIVIAPLATLPNWVREFQKWLPSRPVLRFHGTVRELEEMLAGPLHAKSRKGSDFPLIVTSYEVVIRSEKQLNRLGEYTYRPAPQEP